MLDSPALPPNVLTSPGTETGLVLDLSDQGIGWNIIASDLYQTIIIYPILEYAILIHLIKL